MADQMVQDRTDQYQGTQKAAGAEQTGQGSPLQTPRGTTHIDSSVVAKVAGVAAQEIEGVQMGGSAQRTVGGIMDWIGGSGGQSRGVSVDVGEVETAIDLTLAIEYGRAIPQISEAVRRNVIDRVEHLIGLRVTEVNMSIDDVYFQDEERTAEQQKQEQQTYEEPRVR